MAAAVQGQAPAAADLHHETGLTPGAPHDGRPEHADPAPWEEMRDWLMTRPEAVREAVWRVTPPGLRAHPELALADWGWLGSMFADDIAQGRGRLTLLAREFNSEYDQIDDEMERLRRKDGNIGMPLSRLERSHSRMRGIRTIAQLARAGILPKYGFPVDVVDLDLGRDSDLDLSRDLSRAISDFAPGNRIVANKREWESIGLQIPAGTSLDRRVIGQCRRCKSRRSWPSDLVKAAECEVCAAEGVQSSLTRVSKAPAFVQPWHGFVGNDVGAAAERRPARTSLRSFFFDSYEGSVPEPEYVQVGSEKVEAFVSRLGRITALDLGQRGEGYLLCKDCGRVQVAAADTAGDTTHARPRGSAKSKCRGRMERIALGHWYVTDTAELRFPHGLIENEAFAVLHAILGATSAIGIKPEDLDGTVTPIASSSFSVVLFDAVPGGAGHARRAVDRLEDLTAAAFERVSNCGCGVETSCYGCLRSHRNQFQHEKLRRADALAALRTLGLG